MPIFRFWNILDSCCACLSLIYVCVYMCEVGCINKSKNDYIQGKWHIVVISAISGGITGFILFFFRYLFSCLYN